jgi:hypothetical protein
VAESHIFCFEAREWGCRQNAGKFVVTAAQILLLVFFWI